MAQNAIKEILEGLLMSRAELARKAGVSLSTINRVGKGENCRMDTKRKTISALGYRLSEKGKVFPKSNDGWNVDNLLVSCKIWQINQDRKDP